MTRNTKLCVGISFQFLPPDQLLITVTLSGAITTQEILSIAPKLFAQKDDIKGFGLLLDFSQVTKLKIKSHDIRHIIFSDQQFTPLIGNLRVAIAAPGDLVFGMARMWQMLSHSTPNLTTAVFRDKPSALAWLDTDPA